MTLRNHRLRSLTHTNARHFFAHISYTDGKCREYISKFDLALQYP